MQKFDAASLQHFGQSLLTACGLAEDPRARRGRSAAGRRSARAHHPRIRLASRVPQGHSRKARWKRLGEPDVIADHGSAVTWDGQYLPGPWLVRQAIALRPANASPNILFVTISIRRSHHIGCLQAYLRPVTEAGLRHSALLLRPRRRARSRRTAESRLDSVRIRLPPVSRQTATRS